MRVAILFSLASSVLALTTKNDRPRSDGAVSERACNCARAERLVVNNERAAGVKEAFEHAWNGYYQYAFPNDELHSVSNTSGNSRNGWGASAADALSTAIIMQEADIVNTILDYILTIDFTKTDSVCSLFETTIRYLAGMLSGYDLLTGPFSTLTTNKTAQITSLLTQSVTLADTLKFAFNTATGIPHNNLNINSQSFADSNSNGLATIGTLVLEWTRLSDLTNDPTYANLSQAAESYLLSPQPPWAEPFPGLVGTGVDIDTGLFTDATGGWVGGDDSFYEYLIKMFVYDPLRFSQYRDRWVAAADSSIKYLASHPVSQPNITYLAAFQNQSVIETSQHLACFDGGNFILGGLVLGSDEYTQFGLNLTDGCRNTYQSTASQIGPEVFSWDASTIPSDQAQFFQDHGYYITDSIYDLRPEYLESLYYAYRVTGDTKYQDWSWDAFVAINASTRTGSGFSEIGDVGQVGGGAKGDNQESFLFAEVLKYAYVIHSEDGPFQVNYQGGEQFVFNTEAHPFKVSSPSTHTAQQRGWRGKRSEEEEAGCSC